MEFIERYLGVLAAAALFSLYSLLWRIKKNEVRRMAGVDPDVIYKARRPIQKYFGAMGRAMPVILVAMLALHAVAPPSFSVTAPLFGHSSWVNEAAGFLAGILGLALCRAAQVAIGESWRVGIDEGAKPGLITSGLYRRIRNPTYSGLYLLCAGAFVALPTWLLLYWMLAFFLMMEFQVRCEEEYLESAYGDEYRAYLKTSKRYIPYLW
jgi:protein-S-isoprenylcysteine O-methyltransferase Ste14